MPLILTDSMKASMDILLETSEEATISKEKEFFFARIYNQWMRHIRGCDTLRTLT